MTPAELSLLISLVQLALTEGTDLYDASKLKELADLEVKLQAQLAATAQDRATTEAAVKARDAEIESEIASASKTEEPA